MTLIEIKPHRNGWKVFESPGVEPVFFEKDQAIHYAEGRASFRSGEIRILDRAAISINAGRVMKPNENKLSHGSSRRKWQQVERSKLRRHENMTSGASTP